MDIYTDPKDTTYTTGMSTFHMPTNGGGSILSIAVSRRSGSLFVAGYSVILFFLFHAFWQLVLYLVIAFLPSKGSPNRQVLIVGIWNSGDPLTALMFTFNYTLKAIFRMRKETPWWSFLLLLVAFCGFGGGIAAGIVVPSAMVVGNVAPVRPSAVFFPRPPAGSAPSENMKSQALRAPAAIRAIGSIEASAVTLRDRVSIDRKDAGGDTLTLEYPYSYNISGRDLGLQKYSGFRQIVEGKCTTNYNWLVPGTVGVERYRPWGFQNHSAEVQGAVEEKDPPYADIRIHPNRLYSAENGGNISFAFIPHTAGRRSFTTSADPWYKTANTAPATNASKDDPPYRVDSARPALDCWQKTSYTYNGQQVDSVFLLKNLAGFDIPQAWRDHFATEFGLPKVVDLGTSLGRGVLISAATYLTGNFDAGSSSVRKDIERLVLGTFVASRDIFRDSTMVSDEYGFENAAKQADTHPQPGVADFVLATGKVVTLRYDIFVAVPASCGILYFIVFGICVTSRVGKVSNKGIRSRFVARHSAFQAVQLYRYMDEHVMADEGITESGPAGKYYPGPTEKRWEGRTARIPYISELGASSTKELGGFRVSNSLKPKVVPDTDQGIAAIASTSTDDKPKVQLTLARAWRPDIRDDIHWRDMKK